jgi:hypothetical protein
MVGYGWLWLIIVQLYLFAVRREIYIRAKVNI